MRVIKFFLILILIPGIGVPVLFKVATRTWPVQFVRGFDVVIVDKSTGQPIPGAIAEVKWFNQGLSTFESWGWSTEKKIMSDEQGLVRVPFYLRPQIISYFALVTINARHPLYEVRGINYHSEAEKRKLNEYKIDVTDLIPSRKIPAKIEVMNLWDKYKDVRCVVQPKEHGLAKHVCRNEPPNERFTSVYSDVRQYYQIIGNPFEIKKYNPNLVFDKEKTKSEWEKLSSTVYSESREKPKWRDIE